MSARIEAATKAGMRHYGYTDEQITAAEQPIVHGDECEFYAGVGWSCIREDGKPIHAETVELSQEFEMAEVHIEAADAVMFNDEAVAGRWFRCSSRNQTAHDAGQDRRAHLETQARPLRPEQPRRHYQGDS